MCVIGDEIVEISSQSLSTTAVQSFFRKCGRCRKRNPKISTDPFLDIGLSRHPKERGAKSDVIDGFGFWMVCFHFG